MKYSMEFIFDKAIALESRAESTYLSFMKLFAHVPTVADFWEDMAEDERDHQNQLKKIFNGLSEEKKKSEPDVQIKQKILDAFALFLTNQDVPIKNLDDAFELAYELEFSEINTVFTLLATKYFSLKEHAAFIESMIQDHQAKLSNFNSSIVDKELRKSILARE